MEQRAVFHTIIALIIFAILAVTIVGYLWWHIAIVGAGATNKDDLCLSNVVAPRSTLVILDDSSATDTITPFRETRLMDVGLFVRHERVLVYTLEGNHLSSFPLFNVCNPGRGKEASRVFENQVFVEELWETKFIKPLLSTIRKATVTANGVTSLIDVLQQIGMEKQRFFGGPAEKYRLLLFSPLLQHTDSMDQLFPCKQNFGRYAQSTYGATTGVRLEGVDVAVYYQEAAVDKRQYQGKSHLEFWQNLFNAAGASFRYSTEKAISESPNSRPLCSYPTPKQLAGAKEELSMAVVEMNKCELLGSAEARLRQVASLSELDGIVGEASRQLFRRRSECIAAETKPLPPPKESVAITDGLHNTPRPSKSVNDDMEYWRRKRDEFDRERAAKTPKDTALDTPITSGRKPGPEHTDEDDKVKIR